MDYQPAPPLSRSGVGWLVRNVLVLRLPAWGQTLHAALIFPASTTEASISALGSSFPDPRVQVIGKSMRVTSEMGWGPKMEKSSDQSQQPANLGKGKKFQEDIPVLFNNFALWSGVEARGHEMMLSKTKTPPPRADAQPYDAISASKDPKIDAILWAGYHDENRPMVLEARDWEHGLFMAATAPLVKHPSGRLDEYTDQSVPGSGNLTQPSWDRWISLGAELRRARGLPRVFQVNCLDRDVNGAPMWKKHQEYACALEWIIDRVTGKAVGVETPFGLVPAPSSAYPLRGFDRASKASDDQAWLVHAGMIESSFRECAGVVPDEFRGELETLKEKIIYSS